MFRPVLWSLIGSYKAYLQLHYYRVSSNRLYFLSLRSRHSPQNPVLKPWIYMI